MSRKKRRADGSLRPAVRRARAKRNAEKMTEEQRAERRAWLASFKPGDRARFFKNVRLEEAVFLAPFTQLIGLERAAAADLLEELGNERRWRKLRTLDGTVVGIAPPKARVRA